MGGRGEGGIRSRERGGRREIEGRGGSVEGEGR